MYIYVYIYQQTHKKRKKQIMEGVDSFQTICLKKEGNKNTKRSNIGIYHLSFITIYIAHIKSLRACVLACVRAYALCCINWFSFFLSRFFGGYE